MVIARMSGGFQKLTENKDEVSLEAGTVKECIEKLEQIHPGVKGAFCDEDGQVSGHVAIYINGDNIDEKQGLESPLKDGDEVDFMSGFAGG